MQDRTVLVGTDRRAQLVGIVLINGSLALALTGLYLGLIMTLPLLFSAITVVQIHMLSTVAVATGVLPLRSRIQTLVNRWLHRRWQTSTQLLRDVGGELSRTGELPALHALLVDDLPKRLHISHAVLWVLEPPDDVALVALNGDHTAGATLLVNGSSARQISHVQQCLFPSSTLDSEWSAVFREHGLSVALPLCAGEQLVGVLGCAAHTPGAPLPPHVLELLLALSPQIASAIANVRARATIERLHAQLRELDQLKDAFIESVGHELRTPLTTLSLVMQLLTSQVQANPGLTHITHTSILQLQALIDRVLAFETHIHKHDTEPQTATELIPLQTLFEQLIQAHATAAEARQLRFKLAVQHELAVWGEAGRVEWALNELLDNAVRYGSDGDIQISATLQDGLALIHIVDGGPGLPEDEREQMFMPFQRGRNARALADTPGAGLGLSIARYNIERLGGRVWLQHSHTYGAAVCVTLPAIRADQAEQTSAEHLQAREFGA